MKIGFVGKSQRMNDAQVATLGHLLAKHGCTEFHHGDCKGHDEQAHKVAAEQNCQIVIQPHNNKRLRANLPSDRILDPVDYGMHHINIANEVEAVIFPCEGDSYYKSGWFHLIRFVKNDVKKTAILLLPNGKARIDQPKS